TMYLHHAIYSNASAPTDIYPLSLHDALPISIIDDGRIIENTSVKSLLRKLSTHAFLLDIKGGSKIPPLPAHRVERLDDNTLDVEITAEQNLTEVFAALAQAGIQVLSMKNKANRLEELFIRMLEKGSPQQQEQQP